MTTEPALVSAVQEAIDAARVSRGVDFDAQHDLDAAIIRLRLGVGTHDEVRVAAAAVIERGGSICGDLQPRLRS